MNSLFQPNPQFGQFYSQAETLINEIHSPNCTPEALQNNQRWLNEFQTTPEAWALPFILLSPQKSEADQQFGAVVLQAKLKRNWEQLPENHYDVLKTEIVRLIQTFLHSRVLFNRLCAVMASYISQVVPHHWPTCLVDISNSFPLNDARTCCVIFEILINVRDELNRTNISKAKMIELNTFFQSNLQQIFDLILQVLSTESDNTLKRYALRCLDGWASFCPSSGYQMPLDLLMVVVPLIGNEGLFAEVVDVIDTTLSQPGVERYHETLQQFWVALYDIMALYGNCIANDDLERCMGICRCVVAYSNNTKLLLDGSPAALQIIEFLLLCTGHPKNIADEEVSQITLDVWFNIIEGSRNNPKYTEIIIRLIHIIVKKCQYPNDELLKSWDKEDYAAFKAARVAFGDTMGYIYNSLQQRCHEELSHCFQKASTWQEMQSILFCLRCSADSYEVKPENSSIVGDFISKIISFPADTHYLVQYESLLACAAFSLWFEDNRQTLPNILGYIMPRLSSNAATASAAAVALSDITDDCSELMVGMVDALVSSCSNAIYQVNLKDSDRRLVTKAVVQVLLHCSQDVATPFVFQMAYPAVQSLNHIYANNLDDDESILRNLTIIKVICANYQLSFEQLLTTQNTCMYKLATELVPVLQQFWIKTAAIDCLCKIFEGIMRSLNTDFTSFLDGTCSNALECLKRTPYYSILDMFSVVFRVFKEGQYFDSTTALFSQISQIVFGALNQDIRADPDLLESYFKMISNILKKGNNRILLNAGATDVVVDLCLATLHSPETNTFKASCSCLADILKASRHDKDQNSKYLSPQYPKITSELLTCITSTAPRSVMASISNVLIEMNQADIQALQSSFKDILKQVCPSHVSDAHQQHFCSNVLTQRRSRTDLKKRVTDFSMLCRNMNDNNTH